MYIIKEFPSINRGATDDIGSQLLHGIFSLAFLQFVIAFLSFFGFVLTSAIILILAERKVQGWIQDRYGPIHTEIGRAHV